RASAAGLTFGAGLAVALTAASLPLAAARYGWGRSYGLVTQGVPGWLADVGKGAAIQVVVLGGVGAALAVMVRRLPRTWWVGLSGLTVALAYGLTMLSPVVVEPLFQKTHPLADAALEREILDTARRVGVEAKDVVVNDASRRTTTANAYVSGLGASRHIVLFDTLLRDFPRDQVVAVAAHELAHAERRHVLKGATWGAALAVPACLLVFAAVGWRTGFGRPGPGAAGTDLVVRRVAVAAATAVALSAASAPLGNWVSRAMEREADWVAVRATGDVPAAVGLQTGLVARNLGVPDPPAWVRWWFGTHPDALQRIGLALRAGRG
ncbi:MAG: M48 family metalloprotease, partial [Actinomycetota bacterium]